MKRIRKNKQNQFTQISNSFIEDERLSFKSKGIFIYLWSKPDKWKIIVKDIERHGVEKESSIRSAFKELKEFGYMNWVAVQGGWDYYITDEANKEVLKNDKPKSLKKKETKYLDISDGFVKIIKVKLNKVITESERQNWTKEIRLLIEKDLKERENPEQDTIKAIQAIEDHDGKEYFPEIQSGDSLRSKFTKIENYLKRTQKKEMTNNNDQMFVNVAKQLGI